jgi:4-amino-4-deoxy-L-arabinose transferase-like glycosyltransferase
MEESNLITPNNPPSEEPNNKADILKDKIKNWLTNKENLIFLGIIVIAIALRLYVFAVTKTQPLWWDEAEYGLKAKSFAFGTPTIGWYTAREIVVPFLFSLLSRFGGTEISWRILQLGVSIAIVFMVYFLGKQMFNKKIALIATSIISVNAVLLFFTGKILTYLWAPLFFLLTFYLFFQGYVNNKGKKYLYLLPVVAALGLATYGSLAFGIGAIVLFLFITEKFNFLKKKEWWIVALIGFISLVPQFIYSKITSGSFVARWAGLQSSRPASNFSLIFDYFKLSPHLFGWIFTIFIAIGIIYMLLMLLLSYKLVLKNQSHLLKSYLLVLLWALAVLGFYTYVSVGWGVTYDGFVLSLLPALAFVGAIGINLIYELKFNKKILLGVIFLILILGSFYQVTYARGMILNKVNSFDSVKYAGLWIKENSNLNDSVVSSSLPQMVYYSERVTYPYALTQSSLNVPSNLYKTEQEFEKEVISKKPKYITDSVWEQVPQWVHEYPAKHNSTLVPVQVYYLDAQKTQPSLIIYEVKY